MIALDEEKIIRDMQDFIRCKTVSNRKDEFVDWNEYKKLHSLMVERFPVLHSVSEQQHIGRTGLLYKIEGTGKNDSPCKTAVLMAHYDVVPVEESQWEKPPFDAVIENNVMWGRGTLDTKGTFCSILESVEVELKNGWRPQSDLYLSFSGEEEIDGKSCPDIVSYLESKGVYPDFVLDEGGAIVEKAFPGVTSRTAMIGTAEKGSVNIDCTIEYTGGHSSSPKKHTAAGVAAMGINAIEKMPFKTQITRPLSEMLKTLVPSKKTFFELLFRFFGRNLGAEVNALTHSTIAITKMEGSKAYNVIPNKVSFGMNVRLLGNDTIESLFQNLKKAVRKIEKKYKVDFKFLLVNGSNPSKVSVTDCPQFKNLCDVIRKTWQEVIPTPYLMIACSDSRHYCKISDGVYRFAPMFLSKEERGLIHGNDERIRIPELIGTTRFYCNLLETF